MTAKQMKRLQEVCEECGADVDEIIARDGENNRFVAVVSDYDNYSYPGLYPTEEDALKGMAELLNQESFYANHSPGQIIDLDKTEESTAFTVEVIVTRGDAQGSFSRTF